ncbi:hypothetical protein Cs7R123_14420 [Catellatospora sp. TT07R-123]|nr:hypothetical protein Cs7R123_14420 [Catellatospora sp. TT07R-123]
MVDEGPSWTDILGAVGGAVGVVGGIVFGVVSWRLSRRSALASERSANAADVSADAAKRSADAADVTAREAQILTSIETSRRHNELGPDVTVSFVWRPSASGGSVFAEVVNDGANDFAITVNHHFSENSSAPLAIRQLRSGNSVDLHVGDLPVHGIGASDTPWSIMRDAAIRSGIHVTRVREAFEDLRGNFGKLEILYRSIGEPCACGRTQPDSERHWVSYHEIQKVDL